MLQERFQKRQLPTLGVELELQIVDASTLALQPGIDLILAQVPDEFETSIKREFHTSCVEVSTGICDGVDQVRSDLGRKLKWITDAAAARGMLLAWGGTHPFSHWREQSVTGDSRYHKLAILYQETLLRQVTFGLHVHVAVDSGDAAIRACDRLREYLPILLALSANSPFWCGRATGLQSHRLEVMSSLPGGGIPPLLGDWHSYGRLIEHLTRCGQIESPKDLWWDARPSPGLGTVEIRIFDMPLGLEAVLSLVALVQCLVHSLAQQDASGHRNGQPRGPGSIDQERAHDLVLQQNRWLAARYGLDATLTDPATGQKAPARVLARELVDRLTPIGRELGCGAHLQDLRIRLRGSNNAARQLLAYHRTGDLRDVVRLMTGADSTDHVPSTMTFLTGHEMVMTTSGVRS